MKSRTESAPAASQHAGQPAPPSAASVEASLGPPTHPASRISLAMSSVEFILTMGATRQVIDKATGVPSATAGIEWLASYSLSPVAARQLSIILSDAVLRYEREYGKIPED